MEGAGCTLAVTLQKDAQSEHGHGRCPWVGKAANGLATLR